MSNEIKPVSFRIIEDDAQKFREFAEQQGLNQAEMFQGLMNSFEMAKAKNQITDRAKEIEVFQDTINNLVSMFVNSLAINQSSEERIRETLSLELNTKDKTIADLQEYKEKSKAIVKANDEKVVELEKLVKDLKSSLEKTSKELDQKTVLVDNQQEQINTLNSIVTEYKEYRDLNKELEGVNTELSIRVTDVLHSNADLNAKIVNTESMKEFYKSQVDTLKAEIKELNTNIKEIDRNTKEEIKSIERDHKEEIKAIEKSYKIELTEYKAESLKAKEELTKAFKEELETKIEIEKTKLQSEIDKVLNRGELLKAKYDILVAELEQKKKKKDTKNSKVE